MKEVLDPGMYRLNIHQVGCKQGVLFSSLTETTVMDQICCDVGVCPELVRRKESLFTRIFESWSQSEAAIQKKKCAKEKLS